MVDEREQSDAHASPRATLTDICQKLLQKNDHLRQLVVGNLNSVLTAKSEDSQSELPNTHTANSEHKSSSPNPQLSSEGQCGANPSRSSYLPDEEKESQLDCVLSEVSDKAQIYELLEAVVERQRMFLSNLRNIYSLSFLLIRLKDGLVKSGLNIGAAPIVGFDLPANLTISKNATSARSKAEIHQIVSYRAVDIETIMATQKQQDLTLGSCTLICDLLTSVYKVIAPVENLLRARINQRRGVYYYCSNEQERSNSPSVVVDDVKLIMPTERKQFTQQSEFYKALLSLTVQLAHYSYIHLRRPTLVNGGTATHALPPPFTNDLFIQLCYVFENV